MTNGEIIQSMFPNINFGTLAQDDVIVNKDYSNNNEPQVFIPKKVWNSEYKDSNLIIVSKKYEYHIDHTDCIWHENDSGCPVTCSQYRDGWNDAMEYIFKNGKGYRPYKRKA